MGTTVAVMGLVVAAASASYSAYTAQDNATDAKKAAGEQAAREKEAAAIQAQKIKDQASNLQGEQRAALAASGQDLAAGGGSAILATTDRLAEQDALAVLRGGTNQALATIAKGNSLSGQFGAQAAAAGINGVSSLLDGYNKLNKATIPAASLAAGDVSSNFTGATTATAANRGISLLGGAQ